MALFGCAAPRRVPDPLLPGIALNRGSRTVFLDGVVCLDRGILEYLAVAAGGKEYESAFRLNCRPAHLHLALLIAGHRPGRLPEEALGDFAPHADSMASQRPPEAPPVPAIPPEVESTRSAGPTCVTIDVEVQQADTMWQRRPVESLLLDRRTGEPPARLTWAFTGSFFQRDAETGTEQFVADTQKSLIALWCDSTALLNLTARVGNPYRGDAQGLELNPAAMPKIGTPVRLILVPVAPVP